MVEHQLPKLRVEGSIPFTRSNITKEETSLMQCNREVFVFSKIYYNKLTQKETYAYHTLRKANVAYEDLVNSVFCHICHPTR